LDQSEKQGKSLQLSINRVSETSNERYNEAKIDKQLLKSVTGSINFMKDRDEKARVMSLRANQKHYEIQEQDRKETPVVHETPPIYSVVHDRMMTREDLNLDKLGDQDMETWPSSYDEVQTKDSIMRDVNKPSSLAAAAKTDTKPPTTPTTRASAAEQSSEEHQSEEVEMKDANKLSSLAAAAVHDFKPHRTTPIAVTGKENLTRRIRPVPLETAVQGLAAGVGAIKARIQKEAEKKAIQAARQVLTAAMIAAPVPVEANPEPFGNCSKPTNPTNQMDSDSINSSSSSSSSSDSDSSSSGVHIEDDDRSNSEGHVGGDDIEDEYDGHESDDTSFGSIDHHPDLEDVPEVEDYLEDGETEELNFDLTENEIGRKE
jgi:hypothetical protein